MTEREIRELICQALRYASVPGFNRSDRQAAFINGEDVGLDDLEIDSLAAMELCIAIETNLDVTLLPAELPALGSLNGIVRRVEELQRA